MVGAGPVGEQHRDERSIRLLLYSSPFCQTTRFLRYQCSYEAEDLIQECLLRRSQESHRHEKMYQSVQRTLCDLMRRRVGRDGTASWGRANEMFVAGGPWLSLDIPLPKKRRELVCDLPVDDIALSVATQEAIARLSPLTWWVVLEYFWFGSTHKAIGNVLKVSESRASQVLSAGLKRLKRSKVLHDLWAYP